MPRIYCVYLTMTNTITISSVCCFYDGKLSVSDASTRLSLTESRTLTFFLIPVLDSVSVLVLVVRYIFSFLSSDG